MVSIAQDWNINYITKQIYHDQWKDEIVGSTSAVKEITFIDTIANSTSSLNDLYFFIYNATDATKYHVWMNCNSAGTDPAPAGSTAIEVTLTTDDTNAEVAVAIDTAISAVELSFGASNSTNRVTVTNTDYGSATDAVDVDSGFTIATDTQGVGETIQSVNSLYSWLQDTFDELGQMDDEVPMSAQTPTEYTLINEWFIDEVSIKYLNGGAIQTSGWTRVEGTGTNVGIVKLAYASSPTVDADTNDIGETVTEGTNGDTGTLLFADTTRRILWIRPDTSVATDSFDATTEPTLTCTSGMDAVQTAVAANTGENIWANMYTIGTIESNTALYVIQDETKISAWWPVGHTDVLIRVQEFDSTTGDNSGSLGTIMIGARQYSKLYDHFVSTGITGGRNPVPLATGADLNNTTGTYTTGLDGGTISFVVGDRFIKSGDATIEGTVLSIDATPATVVTYYLSGTSQTTFTDADTVHVVGASSTTDTLDTPVTTAMVPTYNSDITLHWDTANTMAFDLNNGSGEVNYDIAIDLNETTTVAQMYEYLKYVTGRGYTTTPSQLYSDADDDAEIIPSETIDGEQYISVRPDNHTPIKASPFGTFAGGKFFGAQGVWLMNVPPADAQNFQLIDSTGTTQVPPNTVTVSVSSVITDDVVGVFVYDTVGGAVDKNTYTLTGEAAGTASIGVGAQINSETPQSGVLRVVDYDSSDKTEYQYEYGSWSYTVFTLNTLYSTGSPGSVSTAGTSTILTDSDGTSFWSANIRVGDKVTNKTDVSTATVVTINTDQLVTTALSGGTDDTWESADEYYIETVTSILHTTDDNLYVPIINEVVRADYAGSTTAVTNTLIKGTGNPIPVIVRVRQGKVILPFEITNTVTATAGMTQAAIRTTDSIAT